MSEWSNPAIDARLFHGRKRRPDKAIVAPYGLHGTHRNTGPRLQKLAQETGADVIGFPRPGSGNWLPSLALRRSLGQGDFDAFTEAVASKLAKPQGEYDKVLGLGDSAASFAIGALALHRALPLTHMLIRDGINYRAPQTAVGGVGRYLLHQLATRRPQTSGNEPDNTTPYPGMEFDDDRFWLPRLADAVQTGSEILTYGRFWRSTYSMDMARQLAFERPDLPLHVVTLGDSFNGSASQAAEFGAGLQAARNATIRSGQDAVPVHVTVERDRQHNSLLDIDLSLEHIAGTLAMTSTVER